MDAGLVWRRIRLALEAGEAGLARHLGTWLPAAEQPWLDLWLAVQARPVLVLEQPLAVPAPASDQASASTSGPTSDPTGDPTGDPTSNPTSDPTSGPTSAQAGVAKDAHPMLAAILAAGIVKLAGVQPEQAATALESSRPTLEPDWSAWDRAHAAVGQALTQMGDPRGLAIWDGMAVRADNLDAQERRLRAAIGRRDWARVAEWVRRMPDQVEKRDRWLYWQGRAEAAPGAGRRRPG